MDKLLEPDSKINSLTHLMYLKKTATPRAIGTWLQTAADTLKWSILLSFYTCLFCRENDNNCFFSGTFYIRRHKQWPKFRKQWNLWLITFLQYSKDCCNKNKYIKSELRIVWNFLLSLLWQYWLMHDGIQCANYSPFTNRRVNLLLFPRIDYYNAWEDVMS